MKNSIQYDIRNMQSSCECMFNDFIEIKFLTKHTSFVLRTNVISKNGTSYLNGYAFDFFYKFFSIFSNLTNKKFTINALQEMEYDKKEKLLKLMDEFIKYNKSLNYLKARIEELEIGEKFIIFNGKIKYSTSSIMAAFKMIDENFPIDFFDSFKILDKYNVEVYGSTSHQNIGTAKREKRKCRWCKKKFPEVTFKNKAHAISESLGNKNVILYDECDSCNKYFGKNIENHVSIFFRPTRTLLGINGKKGVPKLKCLETQEEISYVNGKDFKINLNYRGHLKNISSNDIRLNFKISDNLIPCNVYKSFCKYALSVIDEEYLINFSETIRWLLGEIEYDKVPIVKIIGGEISKLDNPEIMVYLRKNDDSSIPLMFAELHIKGTILFFIVPKDKIESEKFSKVEYFNNIWSLMIYNNLKWSDINLSSSQKQTYFFKMCPNDTLNEKNVVEL